MLSLKCWQPYT